MIEYTYIGSELALFETMHNWKSYWSSRIHPFIIGDILEVGAGTGSNTPFLNKGRHGRWLCLDPDSRLIARLKETLSQTPSLHGHETACGKLKSLNASQRFDTIIYIDVLEHIENDRDELETAALLLRAGGRIIVLAPAHPWLFTPFDAAIGHFRRYNRAMLRNISPRGLHLQHLIYLDSVGLLFSIANLLLLRQSMPTIAQLRFWDRFAVPISRVLDRCLFGLVGKSIVGIWRRGDV
jgi:SAM-dependent methyltransferase